MAPPADKQPSGLTGTAPTPAPQDIAPTAGLDSVTRAASAATALFLPEEVLAGRFRILRFLGRGGMGEVYEAEDLELGEPVALKTIRADLATHERAMDRFKREIQLARKVTHPNVCRIFDLEHHSGPAGDVTFLTMELLHGETLAERIAHQGRMTPEQAQPIVGQMADGLAAAHRAGVIHRDFKPANVILVDTEQTEKVRAVVTDFGVACVAGEGQSGSSAGGALIAGTVAYMAPELAEGRGATPASDIYSLGIVMYEMVTAARPHEADTKLSLLERFRGHSPSPRTLAPDLDPPWEAAILRCMARDPAKRPEAADVVKALSGSDERHEAARPRAWRWGLAGGGLAIVATVGVWSGRIPVGRTPAPTPGAAVQVTTSTGLDTYPSFSPDSNSIAYASDRSGSFQIYARSLGPGGRDTPLTSQGDNFQPAWSPDGDWIAYHVKRGGIWLVPARGGSPKRLTDFGSRPAWSPDGTLIAFQSEPLVDLAANAFPALPPSTLWLISKDGGPARLLTKPGQPPGGHGAPSWSPDGKRIVFGAADRRLAQIWSVSADGAGLVQLAQKQPYAFDPTYGPDDRVYYASWSPRFAFTIWAVRVSTRAGAPDGEPVEVASLGSLRLRHLAVSRDGRRMAYSAQGLISNLWWTPLSPQSNEGAGSSQPLTSETGKFARPAFSPDGAKLAFDRGRPGNPTDIWLIDADGSNPASLTTTPTEDNLASWFPDGSRVAFLSDRSGRIAVWSIGVHDRKEALLLDLAQDIDWPRLSPDGRFFAFNSKKGGSTVNTWVVPVQGGTPRQLTFDKELMGFPCWSPDGTFLALEVKRGEDTHIAVMPSTGGTPVQLTFDAGQSWPYSWSPDGDKIAFAGQREGVWNVWSISRSTRVQKRLTDHAKLNAYVRTPAWSPRGDRLVYEYAETTGNIWMIEGLR